jgi:hypothetical protein
MDCWNKKKKIYLAEYNYRKKDRLLSLKFKYKIVYKCILNKESILKTVVRLQEKFVFKALVLSF